MPINMQIEYPKLIAENQKLRQALIEISEHLPANPKLTLTKIIKEIVTKALNQ